MNSRSSQPLSRRKFMLGLLGSAGAGLGVSWLGLQASRRLNRTSSLPKLYQSQQRMMGTWVSLTVFAHHEAQAMDAMRDALVAMKTIDDLMTIHRDSSVKHLNQMAGRQMISVDSKIIEVLIRAQYFSEKSEGAYDVTILPLMRLFGFYGSVPKQVPRDQEIAATLDSVGYRTLSLDSVHHRVGLQKAHSAIDLGSIGKGFAVDCATRVLRRHGIRSALIDAGGNLYALGAPYGDPDPRAGWRIGIKNPQAPQSTQPLDTLNLRNQAVATSASYNNHIRIGSTEIGHILNGRTGKPCDTNGSCTVISPTATDADALSTLGYILGPQKTKVLFETPETQFYFYA